LLVLEDSISFKFKQRTATLSLLIGSAFFELPRIAGGFQMHKKKSRSIEKRDLFLGYQLFAGFLGITLRTSKVWLIYILKVLIISGAPGRARTADLQIRSFQCNNSLYAF